MALPARPRRPGTLGSRSSPTLARSLYSLPVSPDSSRDSAAAALIDPKTSQAGARHKGRRRAGLCNDRQEGVAITLAVRHARGVGSY